MDVLGGYSIEMEEKISKLVGRKDSQVLVKMQKAVISPTLNIARKPSRGLRFVCLFSFFLFFFFFLVFFFRVGKSLACHSPGVFVHRAFCAYFLRIERVVELRRFLWWTQ